MRIGDVPGPSDDFKEQLFSMVKKAIVQYLQQTHTGFLTEPLNTSFQMHQDGATLTFTGWKPSPDEFIQYFGSLPLDVHADQKLKSMFQEQEAAKEIFTPEQREEEIRKIYDEINNPPGEDSEPADDTQ